MACALHGIRRGGERVKFDIAACVQHSRCTVIVGRRLAALAAVLSLSVGNVAVCAGWQPTAEARMACCLSDANCPMHEAEGHDHLAKSTVSQTRADSCCAASAQPRSSSSAPSPFASSGVIALVPAAVFLIPATIHAAREWRVLAPLPASSIPRHLLLSVLLV